MVLSRKEAGNPRDYFDKSFLEYKKGFSARGQLESESTRFNFKKCSDQFFQGESWIGLEKLHRLTSRFSYGLKITMTDFDKSEYVAVYDHFKVGKSLLFNENEMTIFHNSKSEA